MLLLLKALRNFQFRKITPVQPVWGLWQVKYMIAMHIFFRLRSSPGFMCACKIPGNVKAPQWKGHFFWGGEVTAHCGFFFQLLFCSRSMETRCYASEHVQRIYHSASRAETVGRAAYVQARTITRGNSVSFFLGAE